MEKAKPKITFMYTSTPYVQRYNTYRLHVRYACAIKWAPKVWAPSKSLDFVRGHFMYVQVMKWPRL